MPSSSFTLNNKAPDVAELHRLNWPYIDRAKWGWTVAGGIADVLPPHERARRPEMQKAHIKALKELRQLQQKQEQEAPAAKRIKLDDTPRATVAYGGSIERTTMSHHPGPSSSAAAATTKHPSVTSTSTTKSIRTSLSEHNPLLPWKSPASSPQEDEKEDTQGKGTDNSVNIHNSTNVQTETAPESTATNENTGGDNDMPAEKAIALDAAIGVSKKSDANNDTLVESKGPKQTSVQNDAANDAILQQSLGAAPAPKKPPALPKATSVSNNQHFLHTNQKKTVIPTNPPLSQRLEFPALIAAPGSSSSSSDSSGKDSSSDGMDKEEPILDMFAYHRGREGMEYRDPRTGQWLTDVPEPTDTGHYQHYESLDTVIPLHISFPLSDTSNAIFKDTIKFDLLQHRPEDVGTTSMQLATDISLEFGLDFGQTMDLAESIQRQLRSVYYQQKHEVPMVMAAVDPYSGVPRDAPLKSSVVHWHGQVKNDTPGLSAWTPEEAKLPRPQRGSIQRAGSNLSHASSKKSSKRRESTGGMKSKQKPKAPPPKMSMPKDVEEVYIEEVRNRLQFEGGKVLCLPLQNDASGPRLVVQNGVCCHRCKKRRDKVAVFSCGHMPHSLCLTHLGWLDGGMEVAKKRPMPVCPVCSLSCTCNGCKTKLANLANLFKMKTLEQKCTPAETSFGDLWGFVQKNLVSFSFTAHVKPMPLSTGHVPSKKRIGPAISYSLPPPNKRTKATKRSVGIVGDEVKIPSPTKPKSVVFKIPQGAKVVPSAPPEAFPLELTNTGQNMDPGTLADYAATYTEKGAVLPSDFRKEDKQRLVAEITHPASKSNDTASLFLSTAKVSPEDGSVDFCLECSTPGELLCCDFCPRAFHPKCLKKEQATAAERSPWLCPRCIEQRDGLPDDLLDGRKSMRRMSALYKGGSDQNMVTVIAIVLDMLKVLIDYDFGRIFAQPVDTSELPLYKETIKKPMDLGTVSSNILNRTYIKEGCTLDDVVVSALNDIELIWQNCMNFNHEGSSYYRMAEVLRRKTHAIRMKSFDSLLTSTIKTRLEEFLQLYGPRGAPIKPLPSKQELSSTSSNEVPTIVHGELPASSKSAHSIRVPGKEKAYQARAVAILNPNTNHVVKIYGSLKNAGLAVKSMLERGVPCEFPAYFEKDFIAKVRKVVYGSKDNPHVRLFGYRWIEFSHLKDGTASFGLSVSDAPKDLGSVTTVATANGTALADSVTTIVSEGADLGFPEAPQTESDGARAEKLPGNTEVKVQTSTKIEMQSAQSVLQSGQIDDSSPSQSSPQRRKSNREELMDDDGFDV